MIAYDVNHDGKADVIASSAHQYGIWWFEQGEAKDGSPVFTRHDLFPDLVSETHALIAADINRDGLTDLVTGKRFWSHGRSEAGSDKPARLYWFEAVAAPTARSPSPRARSTTRAASAPSSSWPTSTATASSTSSPRTRRACSCWNRSALPHKRRSRRRGRRRRRPGRRGPTLRGEYGPNRANNDLLYYHLDVRVDPVKQAISGKNTIRFRMLKDDSQDPARPAGRRSAWTRSSSARTRSSSRGNSGRSSSIFPETLKAGPGLFDRLLLLGEAGHGGEVRRHSHSGRTRQGRPWIYTSCEMQGASVWWPNKDQWRDEVESMDLSVTIPNDLVDVSNGRFVGKKDLGDGTTRWDWHVSYPINNYCVSLNIGHYVHFDDKSGRPHARFLRAAGEPGEGQEAVCAGQGDARSLPALLRRVPVQERRLQADRGAVCGDGASERGDLRQRVCQRLPGARLDGRGDQPAIRLHHHPRERPRVVRQQRQRGRPVGHVDPGGLDDVSRVPVRGIHVRSRRRPEVHERLQVEGAEQEADHRQPRR